MAIYPYTHEPPQSKLNPIKLKINQGQIHQIFIHRSESNPKIQNSQMSKPNLQNQLLLEIGAEGGSIKLYRIIKDTITYIVSTSETYLEDEWYSSKKEFSTLDEAIHYLCNRYPVEKFYPLTVSPEVIFPVAQAIKNKRLADNNEEAKVIEDMKDINQIEQLNKIEIEDWNELSAMLQELYSLENDLKDDIRKYENQSIKTILWHIHEQAYKMNIVFDFSWPSWDEGRWLASFPDFDYSLLSPLELSKLITAIARSDRFRDYAWNDSFAYGMMQNAIAALIAKFK